MNVSDAETNVCTIAYVRAPDKRRGPARGRLAAPNNSEKLSRSGVSHDRQIMIQNLIETIEIDGLDQIVIATGDPDSIDLMVVSANNH